MTHPHGNRRFVPQAVLTRSGKINTAGANVNTDVRPVNTVGSKPTVNHPRPISNAYKKGYSQVTRTFNKYSEYKNSIFNKKVNTVRVKDTIARDRAVVSENKGKEVNAIKASACWGNPQQKEYKEKRVIDSGCLRHMTGNKCYLTGYEDYDGGFVSFGDGKGRIFGKVSQICEKRNNVIFTDTECLILSSDFKLLDENQVLLRVPRKDNIYSVDLKSVVLTKGIKREFSIARTPQQNGVAERRNRTLIEAARTITPLIDFMKPFGYPVTILNTRDHLSKFDGKADEGFFIGLAFDVDSLTIYMNYVPVVAGNQTNCIAGTRDNIVTGHAEKKIEPEQEYILIPICTTHLLISQDPKVSEEDAKEKTTEMDESGASDKDGKDNQATRSEFERLLQQEKQTVHPNSTNSINTISTPVSAAGSSFTNDDLSSPVNAAEAL
ncbi:ribonuclease H-like domain-containing protein [Tanacetum coccineum]